jgi:GMP synthase-like glutamine amidotransferase
MEPCHRPSPGTQPAAGTDGAAAEDPARVGLTSRAAPRICILENDWLPHEVAPHIARFAEPYAGLLRRGGGADWTYDVFHVPAGEWPADETRYDAFILTGSRHDAFADTPWIVALRARVVSLVAARRKLVGICFGHQVLGHCLGAPVGRAPGGWHVGRFGYDWHGTGALHAGGEEARFDLLAVHQDQVLDLPAGARLLASAPTCPVAGFTYGDHVLALQPHPELDTITVGNLADRFRPVIGDAAADAARAGLAAGHDGDAIGRLIVEFLSA